MRLSATTVCHIKPHAKSELDAAYEKFCAIVEALKLEESDKFKFATK